MIAEPRIKEVHYPVNGDMSVYDINNERVNELCGRINIKKIVGLSKRITKQTYFDGRERFMKHIDGLHPILQKMPLYNFPEKDNKIAIIGNRATGKTELIKRLFIPLCEEYYVVDPHGEYDHLPLDKKYFFDKNKTIAENFKSVANYFAHTKDQYKNKQFILEDTIMMLPTNDGTLAGITAQILANSFRFISVWQGYSKIPKTLLGKFDVVYYLRSGVDCENELETLSSVDGFKLVTLDKEEVSKIIKY